MIVWISQSIQEDSIYSIFMRFHCILAIFLRCKLGLCCEKGFLLGRWQVCLDVFFFGVTNAAIDFLIIVLKHAAYCFFFNGSFCVAFMLLN